MITSNEAKLIQLSAFDLLKRQLLDLPTIVCLCGSTRFYKEYVQANYDLTMKGFIVLSVGFFGHAKDEAHSETVGITPAEKGKLDELHKRKIDLADIVYVLNVDGYIGDSTRSEVEYARSLDKPVNWLEPFESNYLTEQAVYINGQRRVNKHCKQSWTI